MIVIALNAKTRARDVDFSGGLKSPFARKSIALHLQSAGKDIVSKLKEEAPIDTGNLRRAHGQAYDQELFKLFVFNRAAYAIWAHEGRKPGKRPPVAVLIPWCRRHIVNARLATNLRAKRFKENARTRKGRREAGHLMKPGGLRKTATKSELQEAKAMAFLVARAIGQRGIKPNRWFDRVLQSFGRARIAKAAGMISVDLGNGIMNNLANGIAKRMNLYGSKGRAGPSTGA